MKKKYMKPESQVVILKSNLQLLAGSVQGLEGFRGGSAKEYDGEDDEYAD